MSRMSLCRCALLAVLAATAGSTAAATVADAERRFKEANDLARAGDLPKAVAVYREMMESGDDSGALYWNWAQVAGARGATGEALWALLRARERAVWDAAVRRQIEKTRERLNLDAVEIAPEPVAPLARWSRALHLDLVAVGLLLLSIGAHLAVRWRRAGRALARAAWASGLLGLAAAAVPLAGSLARPTGVVIRREAPLLEAASETAEAVGRLREGEVLPILERSGSWYRVQDSSGARGWATQEDVALVGPRTR